MCLYAYHEAQSVLRAPRGLSPPPPVVLVVVVAVVSVVVVVVVAVAVAVAAFGNQLSQLFCTCVGLQARLDPACRNDKNDKTDKADNDNDDKDDNVDYCDHDTNCSALKRPRLRRAPALAP